MKIDKWVIIPKTHIPNAMLLDNGKNNGFRYVLESINAIENVPNVLKVIRVFSSFIKSSKCKTSFKRIIKIRNDPIIKNMLEKSTNILPNDRMAKINTMIAKGIFFIMYIILV